MEHGGHLPRTGMKRTARKMTLLLGLGKKVNLELVFTCLPLSLVLKGQASTF